MSVYPQDRCSVCHKRIYEAAPYQDINGRSYCSDCEVKFINHDDDEAS